MNAYDPQRWVGTYFRLHEATRSTRAVLLGIPNQPDAVALEAIEWTAKILMDPIRDRFGPLIVSSWFRSPEVNAKTPGASKNSAHAWGGAVDFSPVRLAYSLRTIVEWVAASDLPYDQLIYEVRGDEKTKRVSRWIHIGAPLHLDASAARKQVLMNFDGVRYLRFDPTDPRVIP